MLRSFAGFVYGIALVIASVAVGAGGHGFVTFFGVVAAPFSFFAVGADKIGFVAIPLMWATIAFVARSRRAAPVFLALISMHYISAILWLVLRKTDLSQTMVAVQHVTPIAIGAGVIYLAGQIILWRDYLRRS